MATVVQAQLITGALSGSLASATTAGNTLFVAAGSCSGGSGTPSVTGVTLGGSAGNFAQQVAQSDGTDSYTVSAVWMDTGCAGGQTAIAVTGSNLVAGDSYILAVEVSGMGTAQLDVSSTGPVGAGTDTWTSDATAAPAGSGEFAIGVTSHGRFSAGDTLTGPGSPWTNAAAFAWADGAEIAGYQVTAGGSAVTYSGTSTGYDYYTCVVAVFKAGGADEGAAALSGTGALAGTGSLAGSAALTGTGTLAMPAYAFLLNEMDGEGELTGTGLVPGAGLAALSGEGALGASPAVTWAQAAALSGTGTLAIRTFAAALSGTGALGVPGVTLGFAAALSGTGDLSVPQASGGLVAGTGGATVPQALPGSSQVAVAAPGSSDWHYLGTIGQVTALTYSYACPGGCDQMTCTVMVPASYRTQLFNPGWQVRVTRGGHQVWYGTMDEPAPSASGWNLTATGAGNLGTNFAAYYTDTWPAGQPDESVNDAISRGLPWVNPGIGSPAGMWLGQEVDPAAQTITDLLNLVCTRGGLTWYVNSQPGGPYGASSLAVFPLPAAVNRLLVCTTPVARTLGGYVNTIWIRYESSADDSSTGAAAAYGTTSVQDAASAALYGPLETYIDLSDAGVMTAADAQAVGNYVLSVYQAASFAGPFTASRGQLLNAGGAPVDPGTDQAGTVVRLVLTDFAFGGTVTPDMPVTFTVGAYSWDDFAQVATITPYQYLDQSMSGLLQMESTVLAPVTTASS